MLDVQNPEIKVDDIMQRIQEKVRLRREVAATNSKPPAGPPLASAPADSSLAINQMLVEAQELAQVGNTLPPMSRTRGLKRVFAIAVAKVFLRLAQLITRDQRAFNQAVVAGLRAFFDRLGREVSAAREELVAKTGSIAQEMAGLSQRVGQQREELTRRLDELDARIRAADHEIANERHTHAAQLGQLRTAISLQERRLTLLLEEARRRLPKPLAEKQLHTFAEELPHVADASYLSFEDAFRGSREEIKGRVAVYLPKLREAGAGAEKWPILDVGCGRGELLEVLRKE